MQNVEKNGKKGVEKQQQQQQQPGRRPAHHTPIGNEAACGYGVAKYVAVVVSNATTP